jgi:hypothetical protein
MFNGIFASPHFPLRDIWIIPLGLAIVVAFYWPGLYGGFFFDDYPNILQVEGVRLAELSRDAIHGALTSGTTGLLGRPVSQLSFAINYFFSAYDPFAFKLTNLVIHCLNSILVYFVARQLIAETQSERTEKHVVLLAGIVAFSWAIHPIQMTSVLYVVQRMTSLSALFLLSAFLLHIRARQGVGLQKQDCFRLILAWLVFWPLSIYSKESGALLPSFIVAYELIIRRHAHNGLDKVGRAILILTITGIAAFPALFYLPTVKSLLSGYEYRDFTLTERLLTEARVVWEYLGLIVAPRLNAFGLFHDDIAISSGLTAPWTTLPALLGLIGLAGIAWWARLRFPLVAFGIAWFFVGHSLESTFMPLEIAHEHRNYLALLGICLLPIGVLANLTKASGQNRTLGIALCCALVGYFTLVTAMRADMFGNDGLRTQIEALHHPNSPRSNYEAGRFLSGSFDANQDSQIAYSWARKYYRFATDQDPAFKMGLLGLIRLDCATTMQPDPKVVAELADRLKNTRFAPGDEALMVSMQEMATAGTLCLPSSDVDALFSATLANPRVSRNAQMLLHSWRADYLWLHEHDWDGALSALRSALALSPSNPSNRLKLAQLIFVSGEREQARPLLLELRGERLVPEEQKTLNDLLTALGIVR